MKALSDEALKAKTAEFRQRLDRWGLEHKVDIKTCEKKDINEALWQILPEAFAVVREAGRRVLEMRHFDVQLIGGMALHDGKIAEMKTGKVYRTGGSPRRAERSHSMSSNGFHSSSGRFHNLRSLFSIFSSDLAIDLGTANTLVYAQRQRDCRQRAFHRGHQQEHG